MRYGGPNATTSRPRILLPAMAAVSFVHRCAPAGQRHPRRQSDRQDRRIAVKSVPQRREIGPSDIDVERAGRPLAWMKLHGAVGAGRQSTRRKPSGELKVAEWISAEREPERAGILVHDGDAIEPDQGRHHAAIAGVQSCLHMQFGEIERGHIGIGLAIEADAQAAGGPLDRQRSVVGRRKSGEFQRRAQFGRRDRCRRSPQRIGNIRQIASKHGTDRGQVAGIEFEREIAARRRRHRDLPTGRDVGAA